MLAPRPLSALCLPRCALGVKRAAARSESHPPSPRPAAPHCEAPRRRPSDAALRRQQTDPDPG